MAKTPFKLKSGNRPTFKTMGSSPNKILGLFGKKDKEELTPEQAEAKANKKKRLGQKIKAGAIGALTGAMDAVYGSGKVLPGQRKKEDDDDDKKKEEENGEDGNKNNTSVAGTSNVNTGESGSDKVEKQINN